MSDSRIGLELHGVRLELDSALPDFSAYVSRVMAPLLASAARQPEIVARLDWVEAPATRDLAAAFGAVAWDRRPDRDLYIAGSRAFWLRIEDFTDLQMSLEWREGRLEVTGRYHFQVGRSGRLEAWRRCRHRRHLDLLRARRFSTILYYLVYHPIFWWLSRFGGWQVLHAGAVTNGAKTLVFAGLPGCGKSTLAVASLGMAGFEMMSDNLLLSDGQRVRSCPEVLLLDEHSLARVGDASRHMVKTGERRVYARDAYRPDKTCLEPRIPSAIFVVERGRETSLEPIDAAEALARIETGNLLAKEVRRSHIMGRVIDLVAGTTAPDARAAAGALVSRAPCFELRVAANTALDELLNGPVLNAEQS